jgi:hypothetical protein
LWQGPAVFGRLLWQQETQNNIPECIPDCKTSDFPDYNKLLEIYVSRLEKKTYCQTVIKKYI